MIAINTTNTSDTRLASLCEASKNERRIPIVHWTSTTQLREDYCIRLRAHGRCSSHCCCCHCGPLLTLFCVRKIGTGSGLIVKLRVSHISTESQRFARAAFWRLHEVRTVNVARNEHHHQPKWLNLASTFPGSLPSSHWRAWKYTFKYISDHDDDDDDIYLGWAPKSIARVHYWTTRSQ